MKPSNGTGLRFFRMKHSQVMVRIFGIGGVCGILSWFIGGTAKGWVGGISMLALAAGLVVLLAGTIAERKEWQAKQKSDLK